MFSNIIWMHNTIDKIIFIWSKDDKHLDMRSFSQTPCDTGLLLLWNMWVTGSETLDIGLCEAVWV